MLALAYSEKFIRIKQHTLFDTLDTDMRDAIRGIAISNQLTLQELKLIVDAAIDLEMWKEQGLAARWRDWRQTSGLHGREFKKWALRQLNDELTRLRNTTTIYQEVTRPQPSYRPGKIKFEQQTASRQIFCM